MNWQEQKQTICKKKQTRQYAKWKGYLEASLGIRLKLKKQAELRWVTNLKLVFRTTRSYRYCCLPILLFILILQNPLELKTLRTSERRKRNLRKLRLGFRGIIAP